ncbi:MAG: DUF1549 and DUF1553 domain-containing protein [Verrucomicrobiales bacterium]|nr:DUF1549 and DUF1553 domain-containing protein [Verrucomicrobiales bacterium]
MAFVCSIANAEPLSLGSPKISGSGVTSTIYEIRGSGKRQNPVRRELSEAYDGDTLFVRFRIEYKASTIDTPFGGEGEFFVLWLDSEEGTDGSAHSGGIPNIGVHVKEHVNHFMARFSPETEAFGPPLVGDLETVLVGRLTKTKAGKSAAFDRLDLWVDPEEGDLSRPDATSTVKNPRVREIRWLGFSTGGKTEPEDRIRVRELTVATGWREVFSAPAEQTVILPSVKPLSESEIPLPPKYVAPPLPEIVEVDPIPETLDTDHWSFQPIAQSGIPAVDNAEWVRSPIDAFIAQRHEELGVSPAPVAESQILARRMALVVTGLPIIDEEAPTNFDAFAEDLLSSPAFGERWGRHWLDVARWAESNGHQHNRDRSHAWRYRDWVVDAFNEDKPYDAFLREQIAGDELIPFSAENIVATGFLAAARYSGNELDKNIQRNEILVDIVNSTSKAFLGLTMECAQCHDHFFDPITQWDYYRMQAFFAQGQPGDVVLDPKGGARQLVDQRWGIFESVRDRMIEEKRQQGVPEPVLVIPKNVPKGMSEAEALTLNKIEGRLAKLPTAWAFYSPVTSPHDLAVAPTAIRWPLPFQRESLEQARVRFLDRGEPSTPGPVATPGWLQVLGETPADLRGRPRLAFAEWLTDPQHPLTARVWVNRIWQGYFGTGLVETSGDFGVAGSEPSHPQLLDWLARELIDSGWSSKHVHRLILRSNTFRQSSLFSASHAKRDPANASLWRWQPRRLEAEAIRDSVLTVAGVLDLEMGGESVPLDQAGNSLRRSLYLQQKRDSLPHQQMLFDGAGAVTSCAKRRVSTTGLQPLWMLNSEFIQTMSEILSRRIGSGSDSAEAMVSRLISLAYQRDGDKDEIDRLVSLMSESSFEDAVSVILNTNEFIYVP